VHAFGEAEVEKIDAELVSAGESRSRIALSFSTTNLP